MCISRVVTFVKHLGCRCFFTAITRLVAAVLSLCIFADLFIQNGFQTYTNLIPARVLIALIREQELEYDVY